MSFRPMASARHPQTRLLLQQGQARFTANARRDVVEILVHMDDALASGLRPQWRIQLMTGDGDDAGRWLLHGSERYGILSDWRPASRTVCMSKYISDIRRIGAWQEFGEAVPSPDGLILVLPRRLRLIERAQRAAA
jgi:hypothetical protein